MSEVTIKQAMDVIKQAMIEDDPSKFGSLADSWRCNIAMMCYDSIRDGLRDDTVSHEVALMIGNEASRRFMKLCFGVETGERDV